MASQPHTPTQHKSALSWTSSPTHSNSLELEMGEEYGTLEVSTLSSSEADRIKPVDSIAPPLITTGSVTPGSEATALKTPGRKPLNSMRRRTPRAAAKRHSLKPYSLPSSTSNSPTSPTRSPSLSASPDGSRDGSPAGRSKTTGRKLKPITHEEIADLLPGEKASVLNYSVKYQHKAAALYRALRDPNCHKLRSNTILKPCNTCTSQDWPCVLEVTNVFGLRKAVSRCTGCRHTRSTCSLKHQVKDWAENDKRMPWELENSEDPGKLSCPPEVATTAPTTPHSQRTKPALPPTPISSPVSIDLPPGVHPDIVNFLFSMAPIAHHFDSPTSTAIANLIESVGGNYINMPESLPPSPGKVTLGYTSYEGSSLGYGPPPKSCYAFSSPTSNDDTRFGSYYELRDRLCPPHATPTPTYRHLDGRTPSFSHSGAESPLLHVKTPRTEPHREDLWYPRRSSFDALDFKAEDLADDFHGRAAYPGGSSSKLRSTSWYDRSRLDRLPRSHAFGTPIATPHDLDDAHNLLELGQSRSFSLLALPSNKWDSHNSSSTSQRSRLPPLPSSGRPHWRTS